jgi:hypothetical protein
MNSVSALGRRLIGGGVIAAFLFGLAAVPEAGAPQTAVGGARLFQGQSGGGATDSGRMIVLLFDTNSMSLTEAQSAIAAATEWTDARPDGALTSVVLIGSQLNVLSDFTADRAQVGTVLRSEAFLNSLVVTDTTPQAIRFGASAGAGGTRTAPQVDPQLADARLRGIRTLCETIEPIPQRKAIIYFSANLRRGENVEVLRAMTTTCNRANVTVNPIDPRGLLMNAIRAPK